jgi:hypothetical protein
MNFIHIILIVLVLFMKNRVILRLQKSIRVNSILIHTGKEGGGELNQREGERGNTQESTDPAAKSLYGQFF